MLLGLKYLIMNNSSRKNILILLLLSIIFLIDITSITHKTLTFDENAHYKYGEQILSFNSNRFEDNVMPVLTLNASLHVALRKTRDLLTPIMSEEFQAVFDDIRTARYMTILFSLLLGFYIFKWTSELYGVTPGLFSLFLYAFSPNIIAHSRLITGDLYGTCMTTIAMYYFWRFVNYGRWKNAAVSAFTLGLSQLAKYTCLFLYLIFVLIIFTRYSSDILAFIKARDFKKLLRYFGLFLKFALFFIFISIMIINIGFLFNKTVSSLAEYEFKYDLFKKIQSNSSFLQHFPLPFPYPFIQGIDWLKWKENTGEGCWSIYLLGELRAKGKDLTGFKGYYFYAFLLKVPIAIQLFIIFAIVAYVLNHRDYNFMHNELFLMCPVLVFTIYFNFFFRRQLGIRNFLVAFPFLLIFCGSLFRNLKVFSLKLKIINVLLMSYLVISVLSYYPHYLSYFNELNWDRKQAYKLLADSNIDWGQNKWYRSEYLKKNPNVHIHPISPVEGRVVVSVNELVGMSNPKKYKWLREKFEPIDHIAYSYLVYDIPPLKTRKYPRFHSLFSYD